MSLEVNIKKKVGKFELDVRINAESRSHIGILGASGCGKSMTLQCIAGIVRPDSGKIVLDGKVLFDSKKGINLSPQKRGVGYLFQNYALFPNMTVEKNIEIAISNTKDKKKKQEIVKSLLSRFHIEELNRRYPSELSGGQQQRVALARILANEPAIIMLDEPFSALDSFLKEELQREMLEIIKEYGGEVIMVSHSRDEIFKLTNSLAIMKAGKIVRYNKTKAIFENPGCLEAAKLTGCKNISRAVRIGDDQILATDWNMVLKTAEIVNTDIEYVGIRAHHIETEKNSCNINKLSVKLIDIYELPFDTNYIVKNSAGGSGEILIKASKVNIGGNSRTEDICEIVMPPERLLLLEG